MEWLIVVLCDNEWVRVVGFWICLNGFVLEEVEFGIFDLGDVFGVFNNVFIGYFV